MKRSHLSLLDRHSRSYRWLAVGLIAGVLLWFAFTAQRDATRPLCVSVDPGCSSAEIFRRDPYCHFDPTCLSPGFHYEAAPNGAARKWQGFAILDDGGQAYGTPIEMLSLSGLAAFLLLSILCLSLAFAISSVRIEAEALVGLSAAWYALEVLRVLGSLDDLSRLSSYDSFIVDPRTYAFMALLAAPIVSVFAGLARRRREHANDQG